MLELRVGEPVPLRVVLEETVLAGVSVLLPVGVVVDVVDEVLVAVAVRVVDVVGV